MQGSGSQKRREKFRKALEALGRVVDLSIQRPLSEAEQGGLIQFFELSWDVGWKVLRDTLVNQGVTIDIVAPLPVIRAAFSANIIRDGDGWALATKARNMLSHSYDEELVQREVEKIIGYYYPLMRETLNDLCGEA